MLFSPAIARSSVPACVRLRGDSLVFSCGYALFLSTSTSVGDFQRRIDFRQMRVFRGRAAWENGLSTSGPATGHDFCCGFRRVLIPTIVKPFDSYLRNRVCKARSSALHGSHQLAQNASRTTWSLSLAEGKRATLDAGQMKRRGRWTIGRQEIFFSCFFCSSVGLSESFSFASSIFVGSGDAFPSSAHAQKLERKEKEHDKRYYPIDHSLPRGRSGDFIRHKEPFSKIVG